jgi:aminoglycoside phosphotransferase (APT) family kinase protein
MKANFELPDDTLAAYLEQHVDGFRGPLRSTKFKGGQSNPTYLIDAASGKYVLRRKPPGVLLASAHAVDREFRVLQALHNTNVPAAQPYHLCSDDSVIGSMFYLMQYIDGRVEWDPSLPKHSPDQRRAHFGEILRVMAAMHKVDIDAVGLNDYGKPGNYFARQIHRWSEQYRASETREIAEMNLLIEQLPARCPADDGSVSLVHGDFRIDNLMWSKDQAHILAIVDWELSTIGHPLSDLAYFCMALRLPRNPALPGIAGMDRNAIGIPEEKEMLQRYAELTGKDIPNDWEFFIAFSFFRLAAIAQGVEKRAEQGNASSEQAIQAGQMTALLAKMGVKSLG